jgi:polyisoprenoid-binding protein YceI
MTDSHAVTRPTDTPAAGRYTLDGVRSSVTLRTRLFGLHSLSATMYIADGQIDLDPAVPPATVAATISAASFSTGSPRRDNDIRSPRFLHAGKYPELSYRASALSQDHGRWALAGELTVRDVTRPVTLEIDSVERTGQGFRAHATTRIDPPVVTFRHPGRRKWAGPSGPWVRRTRQSARRHRRTARAETGGWLRPKSGGDLTRGTGGNRGTLLRSRNPLKR